MLFNVMSAIAIAKPINMTIQQQLASQCVFFSLEKKQNLSLQSLFQVISEPFNSGLGYAILKACTAVGLYLV